MTVAKCYKSGHDKDTQSFGKICRAKNPLMMPYLIHGAVFWAK
ncbi:hypothetical protein [Lactobacillus amylovorus]|nr:hypothetical protein [Lactobacillus amylovorus]